MKGREALKIIEQRIKEGHSKKEIYEDLLGKIQFKTDLLQLIAMVPDQESRIKYNKLNLLLFSLLVLVAAVKIVTAIDYLFSVSIFLIPFVIFAVFISIFFSFMVWNFRGYMYRILGLFGIAGLLKSISNFDAWSSYTTIDWAMELLLGYIPGILIVILAYYIGFKVFPYYNFWGMLQKKKLSL